jgi:hypothetical protein
LNLENFGDVWGKYWLKKAPLLTTILALQYQRNMVSFYEYWYWVDCYSFLELPRFPQLHKENRSSRSSWNVGNKLPQYAQD